ncbi:hypothetical protein [Clostridium sp. KNHs216]|uniref:hypothetical protein n=1 Tax=Clostridium sp. KNHs216 TaxID=1550235 RepID=UPI00116DD2A1|nr:hypothetical protein [Clostridium sp. KNHs216]TQI68970.1 hypothetical protein LY85_3718 [Clostridium sp. KNHs216]
MNKSYVEIAAEITIAHIQARAAGTDSATLKTDEVCKSLRAIYDTLQTLDTNNQ